MGYAKKVPKVSDFSMAAVFIGYGITINAVGIGASIGKGLNLTDSIIAMSIGSVILIVLATASGMMGERAKYTTSIIWRYIYGEKGGRIPSIIVGFSLILWTFFDLWYVGAAVKGLFPGVPHIPFICGEIIVLSFCLYGTLHGIEGLAKIADATIPFAVILFGVLLYFIVQKSGGFATMATYQPLPANVITLSTGINIFVGHFICCTGLWGDLTCEAKTSKVVYIAVPAGMIANMAINYVGNFGIIGLNAFGIADIANTIGGWLMIVTHLFTIVAVLNTTPSTYHLVHIQLGDALGHGKFWCIAGPVIGCTGAFIVEYVSSLALISYWSQFVACVMGPVVGVSLAEFWLGRKGHCPKGEELRQWNKWPLVSLAITFVFAFVCTFWIPSVPTSFAAAAFGFVLQWILIKTVEKEDLAKIPEEDVADDLVPEEGVA